MTTDLSVNHTTANAATPSFEIRPRTATAPPTSTHQAASKNEDSVQLSNTAEQYLAASQSTSEAQGMVEQLVRAAAAGDTGALSLLTVI